MTLAPERAPGQGQARVLVRVLAQAQGQEPELGLAQGQAQGQAQELGLAALEFLLAVGLAQARGQAQGQAQEQAQEQAPGCLRCLDSEGKRAGRRIAISTHRAWPACLTCLVADKWAADKWVADKWVADTRRSASRTSSPCDH